MKTSHILYLGFLLLVMQSALQADEKLDAIIQKATADKTAQEAAAAKAEAERKAKDAEAKRKAEADRKAEETRKANAAITKAKQDCANKGGNWQKGKCVMPPPPPPPKPKPAPTVTSTTETATPEITSTVVDMQQQRCKTDGGNWQNGICEKLTPVLPEAPTQLAQPRIPPQPIPPSVRGAIEPQMVNIPAGTFTMGCVEGRDDTQGGCDSDEKPAHRVTLGAFQLSRYEVTFDEWDRCEASGVCPHVDDAGWGRGKRPVINVSWHDAQTYLKWLNSQTGKHYRLPTEAEWEYAARGGSNSTFPWGNTIGCGNADYNYDDCNAIGTSPVGSYTPNGYGLYDTVGNVWEWVSDWHGVYAAEPQQDPKGSSSVPYRVLRGGSWGDLPRFVRSARRLYYTPVYRNHDVGFRPAQGQ